MTLKQIARVMLAGAVLAVVGCSDTRHQSADILLSPAQSNTQFSAHFDRAIYSKAFDGQMDVILLGSNTSTGAADASLVAASNVSQYVHIKVLYQPKNDARGGLYSTTNSRIDWIVHGGQDTHITYSGAGWARVSIDDDVADIVVRDTTIAPQQITGNMNDPIGTARINAEFSATRDDATVKSYLTQLAEMKTDNSLTQATSTGASVR